MIQRISEKNQLKKMFVEQKLFLIYSKIKVMNCSTSNNINLTRMSLSPADGNLFTSFIVA